MNKLTYNDLYELSIRLEKLGVNYYQNSIDNCELQPQAKQLMEFLKNEEMDHIKKLGELFETIPTEKRHFEIEIGTFIPTGEIDLENDEIELEKQYELTCHELTEKDLILNAIKMERDAHSFYLKMRKFIVSDKALKIIDEIIKEEFNHISLLSRLKVLY